MFLANFYIVLGAYAQFVLTQYRRLWGGVVGLPLTTFILVVGLMAYPSGEFMALRGVIALPLPVFLLLVAAWYVADVALIFTGQKAEHEVREEDRLTPKQREAFLRKYRKIGWISIGTCWLLCFPIAFFIGGMGIVMCGKLLKQGQPLSPEQEADIRKHLRYCFIGAGVQFVACSLLLPFLVASGLE